MVSGDQDAKRARDGLPEAFLMHPRVVAALRVAFQAAIALLVPGGLIAVVLYRLNARYRARRESARKNDGG